MHWDTLREKLTKPIKLSKKWKAAVQSRFLRQLGQLLEEGFTLEEALQFLEYLFDTQKEDLRHIRLELSKGKRLDECLKQVGFSETSTSQIYLSMQFGSFEKACKTIGEFLDRKEKQKRKLKQMMVYPIFLFSFVLCMVLCIRFFLLEQLSNMISVEQLQQAGFLYWIWLGFKYLPQIALGVVFVVVVVTLLIRSYWAKLNAFDRYQLLKRLPLIGKSVQQYITFLYAREFSYFIGNGQSLISMVDEMKKEGTSPLSKLLALKMEDQLIKGMSFSQALQQIGLFCKELIWIVLEGEKTRRLDMQLQVYSEQMLTELTQGIEKKIQWIQPILLMGIGFLIVSMYLILLLPTLTMIGGN